MQMLTAHVSPCAVPDMDPHGYRRNTIDDYVPSVFNRIPALAAPGCGNTNPWVFEDQVERVLYALSDEFSCARVLVSNVGKRIEVGM